MRLADLVATLFVIILYHKFWSLSSLFSAFPKKFFSAHTWPWLLPSPVLHLYYTTGCGVCQGGFEKICNFFQSVRGSLLSFAEDFTSSLIPAGARLSWPSAYPLDNYYYSRFFQKCKMAKCTKISLHNNSYLCNLPAARAKHAHYQFFHNYFIFFYKYYNINF